MPIFFIMRGVLRMQRIIWLIFPNKGGSHIKSAQRCKLFLCVPKRLVLCRTVGELLYAVARAGCRIARGCLITPTSPSPLALPVPMLTKSRNRRMVARPTAPVWDHSLQNRRTADGTVSHKGALCARYGFHLLYFLTSRPYTPRLMLIIWCSFVPVNRAPTHSSRVLCAILGSKWRCGCSGRIRDLPASRNSVKTIQPDRRRRSGMISGDLKASTHGGMHEARWASWCFESWTWSKTVKRAGPHRGLRFLPTPRGAQTVPQAREHGPVRREVHAGGHLLLAAGKSMLVNADV